MEFEKVKEIIVSVLGCDEDEITMDSSIIDDLGADSLDIMQIVMGIEEEFDVQIPDDELEKFAKVGDIIEAIQNR